MSFVVADRVKETTASIGTGTITLDGAVVSFQRFSSAIGSSNFTYYCIVDELNNQWEVGYGQVLTGPDRLARLSVISSSTGTSFINFGSGTKTVFATQPAKKAVYVGPTSTLTSLDATDAIVSASIAVTGAFNATTSASLAATTASIAAATATTASIAALAASASIGSGLVSLSNQKSGSFGITINGQGGVPVTGSQGFIIITYNGTISNWNMVADQSGSAVIDLRRNGVSIIGSGSNKPTLSNNQRANAPASSSWTSRTVSVDDEIEFWLESVTTITRINLTAKVTKS